MNDLKIAFFGTPDIAVWALDELEKVGIVPNLVVTNPDAPQGRKMVLTPPPTKVWATERNISVFQPDSLRDPASIKLLQEEAPDIGVVVAYGQIIPKEVLDIPKFGTLNLHPSLLPQLRGASPIRSAILQDIRETGVTIMLMDEDLDHGPILAQQNAEIAESGWPIRGTELDKKLAEMGGALLAKTIPEWIDNKIEAQEQNHEAATFCTKITKAMGEIDLSDDPYQNLLKIRAFDGWPGTFFFQAEKRIKITDAELAADGSLNILKVIPEGKKEINYSDFK